MYAVKAFIKFCEVYVLCRSTPKNSPWINLTHQVLKMLDCECQVRIFYFRRVFRREICLKLTIFCDFICCAKFMLHLGSYFLQQTLQLMQEVHKMNICMPVERNYLSVLSGWAIKLKRNQDKFNFACKIRRSPNYQNLLCWNFLQITT